MTQAYTETEPQEEYAGYTLSPEERARIKVLLVPVNPKTGKPDYLKLQANCVRVFGPAGGILGRELVYLTGRSMLEDGWLFNTREAWHERTGLGNRDLEDARAILRGDKPRAGRTFKVLEERRPSRRRPTEYRLDLLALAEVLGVELPSADAPAPIESPRGATHTSADEGEDSESPRGAAQSPRGAAQSPRGAASKGSFIGSLQRIPLTGGAQTASRPSAPPMGGDEVKVEGYDHGTPPDEYVTQPDKRHASPVRNPEERAAGEGMVGASPSGDATPEQLVTEAQRLLFGQGIDPQTATVEQAVEAIEESLDKMLSAKEQKQFGSEWRRRQKAAAPPPKLDPSKDRQYRRVLDLVLDPEREVGALALRVVRGEGDREELVGAVGRALGDPLGGEQYRARVTQAVGELEALEELRQDVPAERVGVAV